MSTTEIKRKLITRINQSKDKELLEGIYSMMKDESKKEILILSEAQVKAIQSADEQIATGNFLTDNAVRRKTSEWLGK
jgi:hypothetical protein